MSGISTPVRAVSANCQWQGFGSTKAKVAAGDVRSWGSRCDTLTSRFLSAKPDVLMLQELGQTEAAELFRDLGDVWSYQRYGPLNVVGWRTDRLTFGRTFELDLPDFGQWPGRGYLDALLTDEHGNRLRIGSSHLTVKAGGDSAKQQAQTQKIVSAVNDEDDDAPLVVGIDTNNRQNSVTGGMWRVLRKYGWTWDRSGIDAVLWNYGVQIPQVDRLDLGSGSDHNGRVFALTTTKK